MKYDRAWFVFAAEYQRRTLKGGKSKSDLNPLQGGCDRFHDRCIIHQQRRQFLIVSRFEHSMKLEPNAKASRCSSQQLVAIGMSLGLAAGSGIGAAMQNLAMGIGIGIAVGAAVGAALTFKNSK
jgi:hypothetical protein